MIFNRIKLIIRSLKEKNCKNNNVRLAYLNNYPRGNWVDYFKKLFLQIVFLDSEILAMVDTDFIHILTTVRVHSLPKQMPQNRRKCKCSQCFASGFPIDSVDLFPFATCDFITMWSHERNWWQILSSRSEIPSDLSDLTTQFLRAFWS